MAQTYCEAAAGHPWHGPYHDREYGFPLTDDAALFERLILEINQAGLSWLTILKKREAFGQAYGGFVPQVVAAYGASDRARLLADAGIIRNRLKVDAAIENARRVITLQQEYGSFAKWIAAHHPRPLEEWVRLFKQTFRFTGGQIVADPDVSGIPPHHKAWAAMDGRPESPFEEVEASLVLRPCSRISTSTPTSPSEWASRVPRNSSRPQPSVGFPRWPAPTPMGSMVP
jgi:DNA-3-methyladenine glycosylase I